MKNIINVGVKKCLKYDIALFDIHFNLYKEELKI